MSPTNDPTNIPTVSPMHNLPTNRPTADTNSPSSRPSFSPTALGQGAVGESTTGPINDSDEDGSAIDPINNSDSYLIFIAVCVVTAALICGCVIVITYHRKKKKEAAKIAKVENNVKAQHHKSTINMIEIEPAPLITPDGAHQNGNIVQMGTTSNAGGEEEDLCLTDNNQLTIPGNMGEIYSSNDDDDDEDMNDPLDELYDKDNETPQQPLDNVDDNDDDDIQNRHIIKRRKIQMNNSLL